MIVCGMQIMSVTMLCTVVVSMSIYGLMECREREVLTHNQLPGKNDFPSGTP